MTRPAMRRVTVRYHHEPGEGWWADCPDLPGYSAAADSYEAVREQVAEGLPWFAGEEVIILEETPSSKQ